MTCDHLPTSGVDADPCPGEGAADGLGVELGAVFPEAAKLHNVIVSSNRICNASHLKRIEALRALYEGYVYYQLGYSSFKQYCERVIGIAPSTGLEYVRVARALEGLPQLRTLYREGELSWQQVRAITRVATAYTEVSWIRFALEQPVKVLHAEIREVRAIGRDAPRDRRFGLPNIVTRHCVQLTIEEQERVRAACAQVSAGTGLDLAGGPGGGNRRRRNGAGGDGDEDVRSWLVRWADGILSGAIPACPSSGDDESQSADHEGATGQAKRPMPAQTILYRTCPQCRATTLDTAEGPVAISPERVDELAQASNEVVITPEEELPADPLPDGEVDKPNSSRLSKQVLHRDGLKCANPGCGRRSGLQAHHIVFRSKGGRTVLSNEVAVCGICHALLHKGLLEVTGSPETGLMWQPRPLDPAARVRDIEALEERLNELEEELLTEGDSALPDPTRNLLPRTTWWRRPTRQS